VLNCYDKLIWLLVGNISEFNYIIYYLRIFFTNTNPSKYTFSIIDFCVLVRNISVINTLDVKYNNLNLRTISSKHPLFFCSHDVCNVCLMFFSRKHGII